MATKLTYELTETPDGYLARCVESSIEAMGSTPRQALTALKEAIEQSLLSVEAVAPPSRPPSPPCIDLLPAAPPQVEPQGPGDSPAADGAQFARSGRS
jgi:hypothetical protein